MWGDGIRNQQGKEKLKKKLDESKNESQKILCSPLSLSYLACYFECKPL